MTTSRSRTDHTRLAKLIFSLIIVALLAVFPSFGSSQTPNWQKEIRKYSEAQDWASALRVVDREISRAPNDMDVRAWRARILTWSGRLEEAEQEYLKILRVSQSDPDNWMGLANVYLREGKTAEALTAMDTAVKLDTRGKLLDTFSIQPVS